MSCTKVTCRGHEVKSCAGGIWVAWGDLHLQMGGVITVQILWVKHRCQLVVRLKANKCYQDLLRYLSSYINLLNIRLCLGFWPLHKCYWQYNHPQVCFDCIADYIALIADLIFDCIALVWSIVRIISSWSPSGPRCNLPPWWNTHLYLDVTKVRPTASGWPSLSPLTTALSMAFFCKA